MPIANIVASDLVERAKMASGSDSNIRAINQMERLGINIAGIASRTSIGSVESILNVAQQISSVQFQSAISGSFGAAVPLQVLRQTVDGVPVSDSYIIQISNGKQTVEALLQEEISMEVKSEWEQLVSGNHIPVDIDAGLQLSMRLSFMSAWTKRSIWRGTSPMVIDLNLKFEAIRDAKTDVTDKILWLQQRVLPELGGGGTNALLDTFSLVPPGPGLMANTQNNPQQVGTSPTNPKTGGIGALGAKGEQISIKIGNQWFFNNVVITKAVAKHQAKYTKEGPPISGNISLTFQTYEILTKTELANVYLVK